MLRKNLKKAFATLVMTSVMILILMVYFIKSPGEIKFKPID